VAPRAVAPSLHLIVVTETGEAEAGRACLTSLGNGAAISACTAGAGRRIRRL